MTTVTTDCPNFRDDLPRGVYHIADLLPAVDVFRLRWAQGYPTWLCEDEARRSRRERAGDAGHPELPGTEESA